MNQRGFVLPLIFLAGLVVVVFGAMVVERFVFDDVHLNGQKGGLTKDGDCRSDPNPQFKAAFADLSKILFVKPLGDTQAGSAGRSYVVIKEGVETPIYNPTDATLETIIYAKRGGSDASGEYGLYFRASCEITYLFDHLDKVSDKIKELAPKEPVDITQKQKGTQLKVLIKKGELLGYSNGIPEARTFDFLLMDQSKRADHINSNRWKEEEALYTQCPYEYFDTRNDNNLKRYYTGRMLLHNDNIVPKVWDKDKGYELSCGEVSHDVAGTASGGWFKGESTDLNGDYLSVNQYLSTTQVSIRRDGQLVDALTDYTRDILPFEVKIGQSTCYEDPNQNKWAFVKLVSATQLALAKGNGNCPASFPQAESSLWER